MTSHIPRPTLHWVGSLSSTTDLHCGSIATVQFAASLYIMMGRADRVQASSMDAVPAALCPHSITFVSSDSQTALQAVTVVI